MRLRHQLTDAGTGQILGCIRSNFADVLDRDPTVEDGIEVKV